MSGQTPASPGPSAGAGSAGPNDPAGLLSQAQARALADRVLSLATGADQTRVNISSEWGGNTRFADATISTSGGVTDTSVTVTVTIGKRRASASTNVLDDAALRRTVDLAATLARLAPDDPELMPELGPQAIGTVNAFVQRTYALDPEMRAGAVSRAISSFMSSCDFLSASFTAAVTRS